MLRLRFPSPAWTDGIGLCVQMIPLFCVRWALYIRKRCTKSCSAALEKPLGARTPVTTFFTFYFSLALFRWSGGVLILRNKASARIGGREAFYVRGPIQLATQLCAISKTVAFEKARVQRKKLQGWWPDAKSWRDHCIYFVGLSTASMVPS